MAAGGGGSSEMMPATAAPAAGQRPGLCYHCAEPCRSRVRRLGRRRPSSAGCSHRYCTCDKRADRRQVESGQQPHLRCWDTSCSRGELRRAGKLNWEGGCETGGDCRQRAKPLLMHGTPRAAQGPPLLRASSALCTLPPALLAQFCYLTSQVFHAQFYSVPRVAGCGLPHTLATAILAALSRQRLGAARARAYSRGLARAY